MDKLDLKILELLKLKAVSKQWFEVAQSIRNAQTLVKLRINNEWAEEILNKNK